MPDGVTIPSGPRFVMTMPWLRTSPVHVPRRDLVLGLPATSGKFCQLQSDGAAWQIMTAN